jgi:uncharacterized protein (DUF488 family)
MSQTIYTIGHSTQAIDQFVAKLIKHGVSAIADVRSTPFSRHNPQYNKDELHSELKRNGIRYVFLGDELGARSRDECCYVDDKVQYALLAETPSFKSGITRVVEGACRYKIALMCAEKDPVDCHRTILVARHMIREGFEVQHILANGSLESQGSVLSRLVKQLELDSSRDLFNPAALTFDEAYETQGRRIAYDRSLQRSRPERSVMFKTAEHPYDKSDSK